MLHNTNLATTGTRLYNVIGEENGEIYAVCSSKDNARQFENDVKQQVPQPGTMMLYSYLMFENDVKYIGYKCVGCRNIANGKRSLHTVFFV